MSARRRLWTVSLTVAPGHAAALAGCLDGAAALTVISPPRADKAVVEALYDNPPDAPNLTARLAVLSAALGTRPPKPRIAEVPSLDWLRKVAEDFPPLRIARWTVHGAQHRRAVPDRRHALQIDATSAFGTGEHPTTRGCLLMLDRLLRRRDARRVLDMGCGSGILAMGAVKSRPARAIGIDLDPESVAVAHDNMRVNGLGARARVALGNGYRSPLARKKNPFDLILCNIFAGPLSHMAKDLKRHLQPGGEAILAGLLTSQANRVLAAHRMQRVHLVRRMVIGEWTILALRRKTWAK